MEKAAEICVQLRCVVYRASDACNTTPRHQVQSREHSMGIDPCPNNLLIVILELVVMLPDFQSDFVACQEDNPGYIRHNRAR